jgi:hypothetical protein
MQEIVRVAPSAIKADLQTILDAYRNMAAGQKVNASQSLVDAGSRVAAYIKDHCPGLTNPSVSAP